jgi:hypothetical protein
MDGYAEREAVFGSVAEAPATARVLFLKRTYLHLLGAVLAFIGIEVYLFESGLAASIIRTLLSVNWIFVLGGFMLVGWLATHLAHQSSSKGLQYLALGGYVAIEAIIFVPLLFIANIHAPGAIESAAWTSVAAFLALTAIVLYTGKDFSFLRGILLFGGVVALLLIVLGAIFGFELGLFFSIAMVALAGGAILYDTSNVLHHYSEDRYVGAALQLFASVALLFWYVLRIFTSSRD